METILIYKDDKKIKNVKQALNAEIPIFQGVYDAIIGVGVIPALDEIRHLATITINGNAIHNMVESYIEKKLLDVANKHDFNGISLNREAVKSMINLPDVALIKNELQKLRSVSGISECSNIPLDFFTINESGVIAKSEAADSRIEAQFTYYTKSAESAKLVKSLQVVCDVLNSHDENYKKAVYNGLVQDINKCGALRGNNSGFDPAKQSDTPLSGIALFGNQLVVSLSYVRQFEATGVVNR